MRYPFSFLATPLLVLPLLVSGCHSSLNREADPIGDTELTLSVTMLRNEAPRALLPDDQTLVPGAEGTGEDKVAQMQIWLEGEGPRFDDNPISLGAGSRKYQGTFRLTSVESASTRRLSVMLNGDGIVPSADFLNPDHTCELSELDRLIRLSGFTMTAEAGLSANLKPGIKEPSPTTGNYIPQAEDEALPVERVVSKAQLYQSGFTQVDVPGKVSNLRWAVAGSGKQVYLFRNHAGDLQMTSEAKGRYKGLTTASDESDLMKLSDVIKNPDDKGNFAWKELSATASEKQSVAGGIYFYEHALEETEGQSKPYPRTIGYDKVTYAKVYGDLGQISKGKRGEFNEKAFPYFSAMSRVVYTEEEARKLTTCEIPNEPSTFKGSLETWEKMRKHLKDASASDFEGHRWYWICVSDIPKWKDRLDEIKKQFDKSRFSTPDAVMDSHKGHTFFLMHDTPGTFYVGANGIIYDTLLAARADGNKSARKYTGGRMVYMTPLNAQGEPDKIYNCDTRRNNIYDLEIQGVNGLGYNYDPVDPDDPYIPKPNDNPLEPDTKIPSVNNPLVAIRVKASIIKWNYIHQSYDLLGPKRNNE